MLKTGGKPGARISDQQVTKAILRPGVINWDPSKDAGVWSNARQAGGQKIASATHLNLDKLLHSRYVQQKVQQGQDVREFPAKKAPTPVVKEEAKVVAEVKAKVEAVKEAAKVEAKATALAGKAKATKKAALAGLGRLGFGYLGDQAAVDAAAATMGQAQAAAFAPTCHVGQAHGLPAFQCDGSLMTTFVEAQQALAAAAEAAGDEAALQQAAEAGAKAAAAQGNNKMLILGAVAVVAISAAIYFGLKS
jgi:hypothetical protein